MIVFTMMNLIFDNIIITQMHIAGAIISYLSNVVLCEVMCLDVPEFMIHLHTLWEYAPLDIINA